MDLNTTNNNAIHPRNKIKTFLGILIFVLLAVLAVYAINNLQNSDDELGGSLDRVLETETTDIKINERVVMDEKVAKPVETRPSDIAIVTEGVVCSDGQIYSEITDQCEDQPVKIKRVELVTPPVVDKQPQLDKAVPCPLGQVYSALTQKCEDEDGEIDDSPVVLNMPVTDFKLIECAKGQTYSQETQKCIRETNNIYVDEETFGKETSKEDPTVADDPNCALIDGCQEDESESQVFEDCLTPSACPQEEPEPPTTPEDCTINANGSPSEGCEDENNASADQIECPAGWTLSPAQECIEDSIPNPIDVDNSAAVDLEEETPNCTAANGCLPSQDHVEASAVDNNSIVNFSDLPSNHWGWQAIQSMNRLKIMTGYSTSTRFGVTDPLTRREFAITAFRLLTFKGYSIPPNNTASATQYVDVNLNDPAFKEIDAVTKFGCMEGYPDRSFRPDKNITREEVLHAILNCLKVDLTNYQTGPLFFTDLENEWYAPAARYGRSNGLMNGYSLTRPDGTPYFIFGLEKEIIRAEAAVFLYRIIQADE